ncbi:hypothetical protein [Polyangium sp. y55x31]|uniref:hypothetical protein n=1 Tax=Polyangium sp. y55x31 TaxID=3042688 RepID=UPI0024823341|nr:hypothetical protein [Polyangium sp. y55x31]MDI1483932.1 hypothetical protein [Polyangium sp. y55x31]
MLSLGLLGCATLSLVPLGCGAKITYPAASEGPRVPDATAERLRACVDEFGSDLRGGYYVFDYTVKVDEEGRVVDVASKGVPHADLAGCTRLALRAMTVPEDLLRLRKLRLSASPAPSAERGLVGHPALVVVAIALADLIIEAAPIVVVIAASVEIGKSEIAEVGRKKSGPVSCQDHLNACLRWPQADLPGHVEGNKRCATCFELCNGSGTWPKGFELTDESWASCIYPHIRWYY